MFSIQCTVLYFIHVVKWLVDFDEELYDKN